MAGPKVYQASIAADEPLPSRYTVAPMGGAGVDTSTSTVSPVPPLTWTNRAQFAKLERSQSVTLQWSATPQGASAVVIMGASTVVIMGASTHLPSESSALFLCRELAVAGSFTVPSYILSALPSGTASHTQTGYLAIGALSDVQMSDDLQFQMGSTLLFVPAGGAADNPFDPAWQHAFPLGLI